MEDNSNIKSGKFKSLAKAYSSEFPPDSITFSAVSKRSFPAILITFL